MLRARHSTLLLAIGAVLMAGLGIALGEVGHRPAAPIRGNARAYPVIRASSPLTASPEFVSGTTTPTPARAPAPADGIGPATATPPAAIPLINGWISLPDPHNIGIAHSWGQGGAPTKGWTRVSIPNDFNPVVNNAGYRGQVWWYETAFKGPALTAGRAWAITFESVRRNATVYLNGYEIGQNHNPYAPFTLPATSLTPGSQNTLIVRVDDLKGANTFPEDWWNWGGIEGPVSLTPTAGVKLQNLGVTPELACNNSCGDARVQGTITNDTGGPVTPSVVVTLTSPRGGVITAKRTFKPIGSGLSTNISFPVNVRSPALWSPASPSLYKVDVKTEVGGRVEQDNSLQIGMRSVKVVGGVLYLNGQRLWLHGASIHEDTDGQGAALSDADITTIVSELKSLGANITRAHYQLSPRLLTALDQAGIMVWAQPPVDHADTRLKTASGRATALSYLRSTLLMDRNHPSVIVDSVANELSPVASTVPGTEAYLTAAVKLSRQLNPDVPVGIDLYGYTNEPAQPIYKQFDVLGFTDYFGWDLGPDGHSIADFNQLEPFLELQHSRYPAQALVISEFGAEAFYDGDESTKGTYEFQTNYVQETYGVLDELPFMNGSIYWTLREFAVNPGWVGGATLPAGYTPTGIHHKGLLFYDGDPKPAFAVAQQLFTQLPPYAGGPPAGTSTTPTTTTPTTTTSTTPTSTTPTTPLLASPHSPRRRRPAG